MSFTDDIKKVKDEVEYDKGYDFTLIGCDDGKNCKRDVEDL